MDKGQVNFFTLYHIQRCAAGGFCDFQLDFRVLLEKFAQKQRQDNGGNLRRHGQLQAVMSFGNLFDTGLKAFDLLQHLFHFLKQGLSVSGELNIAPYMTEQVQAGFRFEVLHGQAQSGLGHMQAGGRFSNIFVTANLGEVLHLLDIHGSTFLSDSSIIVKSIGFFNR